MYVYLDESGDLGFKEGSSGYFVITIMKTNDVTRISRCVKRIRQRRLKKKHMKIPELKANNSSPEIRRRFLRDIVKHDFEIHCIILPKEKVYDYLKTKKHRLYNYIIGCVLPGAVAFLRSIEIIVDKRSNKRVLREDFDDYIKMKIEERFFFRKPQVKISHYDSENDAGLQAVDFISWSIFRKYERDDTEYYDIIKSKIKWEKVLFE